MRELFLGQMDYIFFIYGLAFILLFFVCVSLQKQNKLFISWPYLGLFGLLHGINEWLDMVALSLGDSDSFKWVRLVIMAVSFICLFEFGRLTCERFKFIKVGRWIYIPVLLVIFLEVSAGMSAVNTTVRYSLGLTGGLWAALALWLISRESKVGSLVMVFAATAMAVYAVAAGLFVPKAGVLFAGIINQDLFFKLTGFPVQLLRGFAACVIATTILYYYAAFRKGTANFQGDRLEIKLAGGVVLMLVLILLSGWFWVERGGRKESNIQQAEILNVSQQAVMTVDAEMVKELTASAEDVEKPAYQILKAHLQNLHASMTSVRFLYLLRQIEGKIVFLVDSETPGSKEESPPGQVYDEATSKIFTVFASGKGSVDPSFSDGQGTWLSAYAPVNDGRTGKLIAVLGVYQSVDNFNFVVARERLKGIALVGLICLFALFVFVYWYKFAVIVEEGIEDKKYHLLRQWGMAAIVMLFGVMLTVSFFTELKHTAWDTFHTVFIQRAIIRIQSVSQELARQLDRLDGLRRFMDNQELVDRKEFSHYVTPFLKGVPIRALEWIPRITREERIAYENSARQEGIDGYQLYEKDVLGKKIPALDREEYFPVYYLEPMKGNEAALGFDLSTDSVRRVAMEKSRDMGRPVATPPLQLVQAGEKKTGVLVFMPVYNRALPIHSVEQRRKSLKGFVLAVYNSDDFLKGAYSKMPPEGLALLVEDLAAPVDSRVLYRHLIRDGNVDWNHPVLKYETSLDMPDRQWRATMVSGAAFVGRNLSETYWWILPFGFCLTVILAAFLNFLATARYRAERLVQLRTKELFIEKEALQRSRGEVRLILDSAAEAIYGIDTNDKCVFCNPACVRILGYNNAEDLIGKQMHDLIHHTGSDGKSICAEDCSLLKAYGRAESVHTEERFWKADRSPFFVEVWSHPQYLDGKLMGAVVTFIDITERKKAEEALRSSEERHRHIASAITDYIYTVVIENGKSVRTNYNPACLVVTGYSADEFRADPMLWIKVVVEDDRPFVLKQIEEILSGKKDVGPIEHRIIHKDGHICWVKNTIVLHYNVLGSLDSYDGLISDITARREAEKILEEQKKVLDEHAIVSKTDAQGQITYVNEKFCAISKYSREELIGQNHRIINSNYHPKVLFENLWRTIKSGKAWQGKLRNRAKDGSFYWVQSTIVPVVDEHGNVKEYISARTDITQSVENEERLEQAMQVKSNFVSTVSHELRTPLASIKSSIDILDTEAPGKLTADQKVFLVRVKSNIDRLARLINDVLDLSKLESGKMLMNVVPLRPEEVVRDVVDMQRMVIKNKAVILETKMESGLPVLSADKDRMIQVLNNLISNSLKFTKEGKITVEVSYDKKIMTFCVRDTGTGIKEEDLPKLFQKFQQVGGASQQVSGTGLGLVICKEIIERHDGRIWVESQFGKGSAFFFTIPVKHDKRILVVDDDPVTLEIIKRILEATDKYEIELAADGFIVGQKYLQFDPHLIILDVELPKIDGFEICAKIKSDPKTMQTKIMMISSFTEEREKKCWDAGADDILRKPVNSEALLLKVSQLIKI